jgi:single-stranded-DNA-specific exonuclease
MNTIMAWAASARRDFVDALALFQSDEPIGIISHNDADGLASAAIITRSLEGIGRPSWVRVLGRGENPWAGGTAAELRASRAGGLIVADLGARLEPIVPGTPTVIIDHHVRSEGHAEGVTVLSGYGLKPTPSSSLIALWCAQALGDTEKLLWLAALGLIGDLGDKAAFEELTEAKRRYGITALREATALVNAPRRASAGDASPALKLLLKASGPKEISAGTDPAVQALVAAREEVKQAMAEARRAAPRFAGRVALIRLHSACQVHPLIAQAWRNRLKGHIVLAANTGYRAGRVHFAVRSATDENLIGFLRSHAPAGADEHYGQGHEQATGGALSPAAWNEFVTGLGFGSEMHWSAEPQEL